MLQEYGYEEVHEDILWIRGAWARSCQKKYSKDAQRASKDEQGSKVQQLSSFVSHGANDDNGRKIEARHRAQDVHGIEHRSVPATSCEDKACQHRRCKRVKIIPTRQGQVRWGGGIENRTSTRSIKSPCEMCDHFLDASRERMASPWQWPERWRAIACDKVILSTKELHPEQSKDHRDQEEEDKDIAHLQMADQLRVSD